MTSKFEFELTKDQVRPMMEPIFKRIYGLTDDDMKVLNYWLDSVEMINFYGHELKSKLSIVHTGTLDLCKITFEVNNDQIIINVLPETKLISPPLIRSYSVRENDIYTEILSRLHCEEGKVEEKEPFSLTKKSWTIL